ncbi:MAG: oxidoreductase [Chitinophagales bacterium]|nr:MAG: oxidoreductase [Chitinophagales bacterium]
MHVVITGATKGIGRAVAEKFAEQGAQLIVCARNKNDLDNLAHQLKHKYECNILPVACDVSEKKQIKAFARKIKKTWKKLDVLVNNAGLFIPGLVTEEPDGMMEELMQVNFFSAYYLTRELLELMIPHRTGHIFNMCSVAALKAYPNGGSYSIAKHALLGFSRALREELKKHNIRVTTLLPGATYTSSWESSQLPEKRFMDARDLAEIIYSIYSLSERTVVEDIVLRPLLGDI